ncbi:MAG: hypothetical protein IJE10_07450 [Clostridia bacterium]|nr:hypothetical protein [Clostridia bacterium]
MEKRKISWLIAVVMIVSVFTMPVSAQNSDGIIVTPTEETCVEFSGWTGTSGLKRQDGITMAPTGSGAAKFKVPEDISGWTTLYYWVPQYSSGYTEDIDCCATVEIINADGKTSTVQIRVAEGNGGEWVPAGSAFFYADKDEFVNIIGKGSGKNRLTDIKFVSGGEATYSILPEDFSVLGGWNRSTEDLKIGAYKNQALVSRNLNDGNAIIKAVGIEPGEYYVYVHSVDYNYNTGKRKFAIRFNDKLCYKGYDAETEKAEWFGTHLVGTEFENKVDDSAKSTPIFAWEKMSYPAETVTVGNDGTFTLEMVADATYARFDAIILTQNENFDTNAAASHEIELANRILPKIPYSEKVPFPKEYLGEMDEILNTAVLHNENTTIQFRKGVLNNGNTAVQREIETQGLITVPYESGLGFMSLYANRAINYQGSNYYANFYTEFFDEDGELYTSATQNVFRSGIPEWLIPKTLEQVDEKTVRMTAEGTYASLVAVWTLDENDLEPKVTVTATAKKDGELSFGFFNDVREIDKQKVGYVLNPFRWQEKRMPEPGVTITETNSTTDHTQMTYKMNESGQEITVGVAVDQSSIDLTVPVEGSPYEAGRWPHDATGYTFESTWKEDLLEDGTYKQITLDYTDENADFVMNITGKGGGVLPAVFAPKMSSIDSAFKTGDTYTFSYRPLSVVSAEGENQGWYDAYSHVAKDLRGVYDYRDNYYSSMTDAAFNILNLLKDDEASGWDSDMLAHYNIEDSAWATNANGLVYLQGYMLTEDEDLLMRRTLPSMAYMLTRGSHMHNGFSIENQSEGPINKELSYTQATMGNATFEGAYLLSRGQMPIYREIAKSRFMNTEVESAGLNLKNTTDYFWYEHANNSSDYPLSVKNADEYLEKRAFLSSESGPDVEAFLSTGYSPQFQAQLDAYAFMGDEKYLKGAVEGARRFLPTLRITDMPESKEEMRVEKTEQLVAQDKRDRTSAWSMGDRRYRRGACMEPTGTNVFENGADYTEYNVVGYEEGYLNVRNVKDAYPAWVTARTGLGLERFSTCREGRNIFLSTWAGDVLRLGYLSDDTLMMDLARASLVGRFANYPGYYYSNYTMLPGIENYPTEAFDSTSLYFHHIPVFLSAIHDYLFSNAYVKSDGKVDFPTTRAQGYAWFNNRIYGHAPGVIYDENQMWPWLKEGTIEVSSKQIDWIAGRSEGRAAFVLTNAGDSDETVTVTFNTDLGIKEGASATVYDKAGNTTEAIVAENKLTLTISQKGIATVAVSGTGIHIPEYAKIKFDETAQTNLENTALGLMYEGNTYTQSYTVNASGNYSFSYDTDKGYDVKAYALSLEPSSYMGYIFVGGRSVEQYPFTNDKGIASVGGGDGENGIVKATLKWHFEGEDEISTVVDDKFPYEFFIPVSDRNKKIVFNVETEYLTESRTLDKEYTIAPQAIELETGDKYSFEPISLSVLYAMGRVTSPLTAGKSKYCILNEDLGSIPIDVTANDALVGCYLSGYLEVKDNASTADVVESGYVLFDNVPIVNSAINSDKDDRLDFSVDGISISTNTAEYVNGVYVGEQQGLVNTTNSALKTYEWENLYISNASGKKGLQLIRNGNTYTLTNDGACCCFVLIATYKNGIMKDIEADKVIVSVNNSKKYILEENQRMFVWECDVNKGSSLKPLFEAVECN